jgi:DNA-binding transcriptional regulator YhcF (GntR family)
MRWNLDNNTPLYLQIADKIKLGVASGYYAPGSRIDSVRDLAEQTGVNPNTMQRALGKLEDEKLIVTNRTAGKYVTEDTKMIDKIKYELAKRHIRSFLDNMKETGFSVGEIMEIIKSEAGKGENGDVHNGV